MGVQIEGWGSANVGKNQNWRFLKWDGDGDDGDGDG